MHLSNDELRYYDRSVLRLSLEDRNIYLQKIDWLRNELSRSMEIDRQIELVEVATIGSLPKCTVTRQVAPNPLHIDLAICAAATTSSADMFDSLNDRISTSLAKHYPDDRLGEFKISRNANGLAFVAAGLSVDIVPAISIKSQNEDVWQLLHQGRPAFQTNPLRQEQFIYSHACEDSDYRTLVRLAKQWRNHMEVAPLTSYMIELLMASIQDRDGCCLSIESRFLSFLCEMDWFEAEEAIAFPDGLRPISEFSDPVMIIDPACGSNNVASCVSEAERKEIVLAAEKAYEFASAAHKGSDNETWKEIFGPGFKTGHCADD